MQSWQYKVVVHETKKLLKDETVIDEVSKALNEPGEQGWDLVSVAPFSSTQGLDLGGSTKAHTFVFKRPA